jgi:hypothetical protein
VGVIKWEVRSGMQLLIEDGRWCFCYAVDRKDFSRMRRNRDGFGKIKGVCDEVEDAAVWGRGGLLADSGVFAGGVFAE